MIKTEILAALPELTAEERRQVFERLCELQEQDLLQSAGPNDEERRVLDEALAESERDRDPGSPWRQVIEFD